MKQHNIAIPRFAATWSAALFLPGALALVAVSGCADGATCDPDEHLSGGLCLPNGSGAKSEPPDAASGGDGGGTDGGKTVEFGAECRTNEDCGVPAPVCAIQPTDEKGFCSQIGCAADPSVCPPSWQCFDPSVINPDWPTVCVPPS